MIKAKIIKRSKILELEDLKILVAEPMAEDVDVDTYTQSSVVENDRVKLFLTYET
jgi:hypothetical protein